MDFNLVTFKSNQLKSMNVKEYKHFKFLPFDIDHMVDVVKKNV